MGTYDVEQGPVLYIMSEGKSGVFKRCKAWMKQHNVVAAPEKFAVVPSAFDLLDKWEVPMILEIAKESLGCVPALIVVDTLARNFGSGNENSPEDMNKYIANLDCLRSLGATVMSVHHTGHLEKGRMRASSNLPGAADSIMRMQFSEKDQHIVLVHNFKQKDHPQFEDYMLKLASIELPELGEQAKSAVFIPRDRWKTRYRLMSKNVKSLFDVLGVSFGSKAFRYTDAKEASKLADSTFKRHFGELQEKEFVAKQPSGDYVVNGQAKMALAV